MGAVIQNSFSIGEIAPTWVGRGDVASYASAVKKMQNFIPIISGGAKKRPGTKYLGQTKNSGTGSNEQVRIIPYQVTNTRTIFCEFGHQYVRFWDKDGQIQSGGSAVEPTWAGAGSGFSGEDLSAIKYVQVQSVLYLAHRDYPLAYLQRSSDTSWTYDEVTLTVDAGWTPDLETADERMGAIAVYEQRLILGGANDYPGYIAGSEVGILSKFDPSSPATADEAFYEQPAGYERVDVQWMHGQNFLLIGSADGLWRAGKSDAPINASETQGILVLRRQSSVGSAPVQGIAIDDYVVFVERGRSRIRMAQYEQEQEQFVTTDVSMTASHFFEGKTAEELHYQLVPTPILWVVRSSGGPVALVYNEATGTVAWTEFVFQDGNVVSMGIGPGETEDEVCLLVEREIDGTTERYVELMTQHYIATTDDCWFSDSAVETTVGTEDSVEGITLTGTDPVSIDATAHGLSNGDTVKFSSVGGTTELNGRVYTVSSATTDAFELQNTNSSLFTAWTSGGVFIPVTNTISLAHLEGETVSVWADGAVQSDQVVDSGSITLDKYATHVVAGLPYTARIDLLPATESPHMTKTAYKVHARFYNTIGGKTGVDEDDLVTISFLEPGFIMGAGPEYFSGVKTAYVGGRPSRDQSIIIQSDQPTPMTVLMVAYETGVQETLQ